MDFRSSHNIRYKRSILQYGENKLISKKKKKKILRQALVGNVVAITGLMWREAPRGTVRRLPVFKASLQVTLLAGHLQVQEKRHSI